MNAGEILSAYGKYYDVLQRLGGFRLSENPELSDLTISKALLQAAYREIRGSDFQGSLVDYLCLVSTSYVVWSLRSESISQAGALVMKKYFEMKQDIKNLLRLFTKNPNYFFDSVGEQFDSVEKELAEKYRCVKKISGFWYMVLVEASFADTEQVSDGIHKWAEMLDNLTNNPEYYG